MLLVYVSPNTIIKVSQFSRSVHMHDKAALFETITKCVDYASVLIFKCLD